jgi:hypothetical protein
MPRRPPSLLVAASVILLALGAAVATAWTSTGPATAAAGSPQAGSDRWAFVVGVSDYAGRTSSTVAGADDAADFRELLLRNGFREDRIRTITEGQATARNIREGLQWLVDNSSPESFSVFHFSGHVKQLGGDRDRDGEKVDEYLWPHDNVFISDAELAGRVQQLRGLAWIDIAGCEAGGFDDGISAPTRVFTGSSGETEKSYEHPDWRNSVFTGLEIDQAWLQGQADHDGNGKISIQEAFAFAHERAPKVTAGQRRGAQHPVSAGGDGSQWFLDGPPAPPAPTTGEPDGRCRQLICFRP